MISNHISDLITATKEMPNSEWRNKVLSHLKDAYAASKVLENNELGKDTAKTEKTQEGASTQSTVHDLASSVVCICEWGEKNPECFWHGTQDSRVE